jgi:peptidyl-prolyl cis-trans isomerase SurA
MRGQEIRYEYRASHIFINLDSVATPEQTTVAYGKADMILAQLREGVAFEDVAMQHSEDPSVAQNKGDLYYSSAGQMVKPFEDAVFAMKVGEVSEQPVRTKYGLHVIKLLDRRMARGEIRARHIMVRFDKYEPTPPETLAAYIKIQAIRDSLMMGAYFPDLARRNSGDPGSAEKGGDLGWFKRRRWIQSFDEAVQLLRPGQVSDIVKTNYGYHIIECTDERPPSLDDVLNSICRGW